jgi:hypothetical protein
MLERLLSIGLLEGGFRGFCGAYDGCRRLSFAGGALVTIRRLVGGCALLFLLPCIKGPMGCKLQHNNTM